MIQIVLIDDERDSLETLEWKISQYCTGVQIIQTFTSPVDALSYLKEHKVDLVFLDIEMPILNGFELLHKISEIKFDVVFTTAYDDYGIKAIKYSALDYLLKPIQVSELVEAIEKFQKKQLRNILPQQLEVLFHSLSEKNSKSQKIALSTKESIELVSPRDIILCESDSNYTTVYLEGRKKLISKTLKEFEELLEVHNFFRSHQSYLINMDRVSAYIRQDGGYIKMKNGMTVPLSRSKKDSFLKQF